MHSLNVDPIKTGVCCFVLVAVVAASPSDFGYPICPKVHVCAQLCQQFNECVSSEHQARFLACCMSSNEENDPTFSTKNTLKSITYEQGVLIFCGNRILLCTQNLHREHTDQETTPTVLAGMRREKQINGRLLLLGTSGDQFMANLLHLGSNFHHHQIDLYAPKGTITGIVYVSVLKKLIGSTKGPNAIFSTPVCGGGGTVIYESKRTCLGIAVDEAAKRIFILSPNFVEWLQFSGTRAIVISSRMTDTLSIAVHPRQRRVYISTKREIMSVSYGGSGHKVLVRGTVSCFTLGVSDRVIYYVKDHKLYKYSLLQKVGSLYEPAQSVFGTSALLFYNATLCTVTMLTSIPIDAKITVLFGENMSHTMYVRFPFASSRILVCTMP